MESQITFQSADGEPIVRQLDEVMVEAALLEANFGSSLSKNSSFNNPIPLQAEVPREAQNSSSSTDS